MAAPVAEPAKVAEAAHLAPALAAEVSIETESAEAAVMTRRRVAPAVPGIDNLAESAKATEALEFLKMDGRWAESVAEDVVGVIVVVDVVNPSSFSMLLSSSLAALMMIAGEVC